MNDSQNCKHFASTENGKPHKYWLPAVFTLFELGVFFVVINFIYLSFMQIHAHFYINYIIYYGLLIFCCQNVATHLL